MTFFSRIRIEIQTACALGLINVGRVLLYRLSLKLGINPAQHIRIQMPSGPFFKSTSTSINARSVSMWRHEVSYFGWYSTSYSTEGCPDWYLDPFSKKRFDANQIPWWQISDFDTKVGDIKTIWEISRFDWVLAMAQRLALGETKELDKLNVWLTDWCYHNPPYYGPNWKCGQEAAIRAVHLAVAALFTNQTCAPCPGLLDLIEVHLRRIAPTMSYAIAQDNNHGISEAAALFIGGSWLAKQGREYAAKWERQGRRWLENRVKKLVSPDGSFSQYSVNYHRLMLDTLSMVEIWCRYMSLRPLSQTWCERADMSARWLATMVDPTTGDAPNLGSNDGARLLPLTDTDYRDFRPSVQLATVLFTNSCTYSTDGPWNEPLRMFNINIPEKKIKLSANRVFKNGGYAILRRGSNMTLLRYPKFRFRPSHADALHLDFWVNGENLLRDAGSFSYNTDLKWMNYFSGTASHNTIQFDDSDQMPRLGRFLFGNWLKLLELTPLKETAQSASIGASYRDRKGATHKRDVLLENKRLLVCDEISAFERHAILRWRLRPGSWRIEGQSVSDGKHRLSIQASMQIKKINLVQGWESRYYLKKTELPVLEVEVAEPGTLTSEYTWVL